MTHSRPHAANHTSRRHLVRALLLATVALSLASGAMADGFLDNSTPDEPRKPTWAVPAKRMPVEGTGGSAAEAELRNAKMRLLEARQNADTAMWSYTRARTRRYPRGEALVKIRNRLAEMNNELTAAENDFVAFVEKARQSGVPAGTLLPYMDIADEIRRAERSKPDTGF